MNLYHTFRKKETAAKPEVEEAAIRAEAAESYAEAAIQAAQTLAEADIMNRLTHSVGA